MINFARDVHFAEIDRDIAPGGTTRLVLKSDDGENTTFVLPHDPLAIGDQVPGAVPVWKLNLSKIQSWPICRRAVLPVRSYLRTPKTF